MTTVKLHLHSTIKQAYEAALLAGISDECLLEELAILGRDVILTYEVDERERTWKLVEAQECTTILTPIDSCCVDSIVIEGAGTTELNGIYKYFGNVNNAKAYRLGGPGSNKVIFYDLTLGWEISDGVPYYISPGGLNGPTGPWMKVGTADLPNPNSRFTCA